MNNRTTTWYADLHEETVIQSTLECSSPFEQSAPQKIAPASNIHYEDFSNLSFMTRKDHYEWVELYAKEQLFSSVKSCLNYKGFHEYGFHLLSLTPRPLLEIRTNDNRPIHSLPLGNSTALEYFLRYVQSPGGGGYFRNFWVGMCRWDPDSDLYPWPGHRVNCLKTIHFTAAHTYTAYMWQYPPPPGVLRGFTQARPQGLLVFP